MDHESSSSEESLKYSKFWNAQGQEVTIKEGIKYLDGVPVGPSSSAATEELSIEDDPELQNFDESEWEEIGVATGEEWQGITNEQSEDDVADLPDEFFEDEEDEDNSEEDD